MTFTKDNCKFIGKNNPNWVGNNIGYHGLHDRIRKLLKKPRVCPKCKRGGWIELSNKSHRYKLDISDWEYLCRSCHASYDKRVKQFKGLKPWSKKNRRLTRKCIRCRKNFSMIISILKRPDRGKFCSRKCSSKGRLVPKHYNKIRRKSNGKKSL